MTNVVAFAKAHMPSLLSKQENGRKTTIVSVYFAHASPWLFTISITKPLLDFVHLLFKCGSRTKATHFIT